MTGNTKPPPPPPPNPPTAESQTKASIHRTQHEEGKRWQVVAENQEAVRKNTRDISQQWLFLNNRVEAQNERINKLHDAWTQLSNMQEKIMTEVSSIQKELASLRQDFDERDQFLPMVPDLQVNGKQNVNPYKLRFA